MSQTSKFDTAAAVTRSLLGWGVVAGIFYLITGVVHGVLREGFDFSRHALSLLMLGPSGWVQSANLILSGLMVMAAALGLARVILPAKRTSMLLGVYGLALIASGIFPPDPMAGFPEGAVATGGSLSGILHLAFGAVGFVALAVAAFMASGWLRGRREAVLANLSRLAGAVILLGFIGGAALSAGPAGVLLLWLAVVAGWAWLAIVCAHAYRTVPHPDVWRRGTGAVS